MSLQSQAKLLIRSHLDQHSTYTSIATVPIHARPPVPTCMYYTLNDGTLYINDQNTFNPGDDFESIWYVRDFEMHGQTEGWVLGESRSLDLYIGLANRHHREAYAKVNPGGVAVVDEE